jgi:hypothetical protein
VPAIDRGATLPPQAGVARVVSTRERAEAFAREIEQGEATPSRQT